MPPEFQSMMLQMMSTMQPVPEVNADDGHDLGGVDEDEIDAAFEAMIAGEAAGDDEDDDESYDEDDESYDEDDQAAIDEFVDNAVMDEEGAAFAASIKP